MTNLQEYKNHLFKLIERDNVMPQHNDDSTHLLDEESGNLGARLSTDGRDHNTSLELKKLETSEGKLDKLLKDSKLSSEVQAVMTDLGHIIKAVKLDNGPPIERWNNEKENILQALNASLVNLDEKELAIKEKLNTCLLKFFFNEGAQNFIQFTLMPVLSTTTAMLLYDVFRVKNASNLSLGVSSGVASSILAYWIAKWAIEARAKNKQGLVTEIQNIMDIGRDTANNLKHTRQQCHLQQAQSASTDENVLPRKKTGVLFKLSTESSHQFSREGSPSEAPGYAGGAAR